MLTRIISFVSFVLTLLLVGACASTSVKHRGRPAGQIKLPLDGVYRATIIPPFDFIGPLSGRISAKPTPTGFVASSRPDIAWDMIGGVQGVLGSLFVPFIFPGGTIGTWTSGVPQDGKPGEGWFGVGGIKNAGVKTRMTAADRDVELLVQDGRRVGLLRLEPEVPDGPPLADYPALATNIIAAIQDKLYDRKLLDSVAIGAYSKQLKYNATIARDDVEFIFGAVSAARNYIKFTMPIAFRKGDPATRAAMTDWSASEIKTVRATFDAKTKIATFKSDAFLRAEDVDRVFEKIEEWKPKGLIIDLRSSPGVTLAALRVLNWVAKEDVAAGMWFGSAKRESTLGGTSISDEVVVTSAADIDRAERALDANGAVRVVVRPGKSSIRVPLAVLTSKRTSASAEVLAQILKQSCGATVFGQVTAGKPYLSRPIDIGQGWVLWLAAADYISPTGTRLNDTGVKPDVETPAPQQRAERWILKQLASEPVTAIDDASSVWAPFLTASERLHLQDSPR